MLAFASGTIEIIAGDSGAGERIPALAQEASRPGSPRSNTATFNPACASSKAMAEPISPAPAIATSKDFMLRFYRIHLAHSRECDCFQRRCDWQLALLQKAHRQECLCHVQRFST